MGAAIYEALAVGISEPFPLGGTLRPGALPVPCCSRNTARARPLRTTCAIHAVLICLHRIFTYRRTGCVPFLFQVPAPAAMLLGRQKSAQFVSYSASLDVASDVPI